MPLSQQIMQGSADQIFLLQADGIIAESVANAPGGPVHVLLTDDIAEHIPGCNMAFRRDVLQEVGGCDGKYRTAGDDVDLCWRIQEKGYTIGFHPSAVVWHHRRNSVRMYWKQQKGYGKAEALLEEKWASKYNCFGHLTWGGRIYGKGLTQPLKLTKDEVFHGTWGTALFQSIYQSVPNTFSSVPLMPEWYFVVIALGMLSALGFFWQPMLLTLPFFIFAFVLVFLQAGTSAAKAIYATPPKSNFESFYRWCLTAFLHIIQPLARLYGRLQHGLTPWRKRGIESFDKALLIPKIRDFVLWSETWKSSEDWLLGVENTLNHHRVSVKRGGDFDRWDLETGCGLFACSRGLLTIEEHGGGKQYLKFRCWSDISRIAVFLSSFFAVLTLVAVASEAFIVSIIFGIISLLVVWRVLKNSAKGTHILSQAFLNQDVSKPTISEIEEGTHGTGMILPESPKVAVASAFSAATEIFSQTNFRKTETKPLD